MKDDIPGYDIEVDIRTVPVDRLATFEEAALQSRRTRLEYLLAQYAERVESTQKALDAEQKLYAFLQREHNHVVLAQRLAKGDVVRVVCPACKGSGMKAADVLSGQISTNRGSAFEGVGGPVGAPQIDERNRCPECKGQRWQIMDRFKG